MYILYYTEEIKPKMKKKKKRHLLFNLSEII